MRLATYNVASVRARLPLVIDWLAEHNPDVLVLQETKVENDKFPLFDFESLGYQVALNGQKSWNGVAIVSKHPITGVRLGFGDPLMPEDARIIAGEVAGLTIINTYLPNGNQVGSEKWIYKMQWLDRFKRYLTEGFDPNKPLVWLGDINIAPRPQDVYDSPKFLGGVGHHPDEFSKLAAILEFGLTDLFVHTNDAPGSFTFWDFVIPRSLDRNLGWRIDHIYGTRPIVERAEKVWVDRDARSATKPSDHTVVVADLRD